MNKRISSLLITLFVQFLFCSCPQWNIEGPMIPTGGVELEEIYRFSVNETIKSISYADNYILVKGDFNFTRIDVSSPEKPSVINTFQTPVYYDFSFTGNKMFFTTRDPSLVIYEFDAAGLSLDTLKLDQPVRKIKSNMSYSFISKRCGFYVVKHEDFKVVFTYSDLGYSSPPNMYVDSNYLYTEYSDLVHVFSISDCEKPVLVQQSEVLNEDLLDVNKSYSVHGSYSEFFLRLQFMSIFSGDTQTIDLPKYSFFDLCWDNEFLFTSLRTSDSVKIATLNPPPASYPSVLHMSHLDAGVYYKLAASKDYLYTCREDTLIIFKIKKIKQIWED